MYILTRKFNNKYRYLYALFMDADKKTIVLYSTILLNFLLSIFFLIFIDKYDLFAIYMLAFTNIISCFVSHNLRVIISSILYGGMEIELLWLLRIVDNYLNYVIYDNRIFILKFLFIIMIFIYDIFTVVRRTEILLKK